MDFQAGDEVVLLEQWPLQPGSNMSLQPGEGGRVLRCTAGYCAIEVFGTVLVVPKSKLRLRDEPEPVLTDDDEWWKV